MTYSGDALQPFIWCKKDEVFPSFEKSLFPHLSSQDIVEISGEAGSGKTELMYHFITCCVFPSAWKGIQLEGLQIEVTLIDNDCHFDLFRLVTVMENRIKTLIRASKTSISKKEIFVFIQETLKLLHIIKCYDSNEFILTLNSLESTLSLKRKRNIVMIDGLSSFYLADRAVFQNNFSKLISHYKKIINLIVQISKKYTPVVLTKRKLLNTAENDKRCMGHISCSASTWRFEIVFKSSLPDRTLFTLLNTQNGVSKLCSVSTSGFAIVE